jgi:hypothetical protein
VLPRARRRRPCSLSLTSQAATPDFFGVASDSEMNGASLLPGTGYKAARARDLIVSVLEELSR